MNGIIAVHCGAGSHGTSQHRNYNKLARKACRKGAELLRNGVSALEVVKIVISVLEDDPLTNCGYGSNLTEDGCVETDASIMDGKTLIYGGCGAVRNVKNPITLAHDICIKQLVPLPLGLVPPSFVVGKGGFTHAKNTGLKTVKQKSLISAKALRQYKKYKKFVDCEKGDELLDTVGAVCVDNEGHVAAGCSSGGILLKRAGRVGQAAVYASGVWADSVDKSEPAIAVCTSGCGEYLMRTQLAQVIAEDVRNTACPTVGLSQCITDKFLNSRYLKDVTSKLCGALVLHIDNNTGDKTLLWGHTTETMSIGFMRCHDDKPQAFISELPTDVAVGTKVNVSGVFSSNKD